MTDSASHPEQTYRDPADGCLTRLALIGAVTIVYLAALLVLSEAIHRAADWADYTTPLDFNLLLSSLGILVIAWALRRAGWIPRFLRRYHAYRGMIAVLFWYMAGRFLPELLHGLGLLTVLPTCQDFKAPLFLPWGGTDQEIRSAISEHYLVSRAAINIAPDPLQPDWARAEWTTVHGSFIRSAEQNGLSMYSRLVWRSIPARFSLITRCLGEPAGFALADDAENSDTRRLVIWYSDGHPVISGTFHSSSAGSLEEVAFDRVLWARDEVRDDSTVLAQLASCDEVCGEPSAWTNAEDVNQRLGAAP